MTDYTTLSDEQLSQSKEAIEAEIARRADAYGQAVKQLNRILFGPPNFGPDDIRNALIAAWPHMPETKALQERVAELEAVIAMHRDGPMADLIAGDADLIDDQPDDGWIEHDGKWSPLPPETKVQVKQKDGIILAPRSAREIAWVWSDWHPPQDITHYRIVKGQDDE